MVLPIDTEDYSYRFYKTLNMDVTLTSNEYGEWDIVFDNDNKYYVNVVKEARNGWLPRRKRFHV